MTTTADGRVLSFSFLLTDFWHTWSVITAQMLALNIATKKTKKNSVIFEYGYKDRTMRPFFSFPFDRVGVGVVSTQRKRPPHVWLSCFLFWFCWLLGTNRCSFGRGLDTFQDYTLHFAFRRD
jgi:hypothetical protein